MSGMYQATPEQLRQAAVGVARTNEQIQARLSRLQSQLAPLAGAWKGQAATAFTALMERWNADARALNRALQGIGDAIEASGLGYQQVEEAQARGMSAITSALG